MCMYVGEVILKYLVKVPFKPRPERRNGSKPYSYPEEEHFNQRRPSKDAIMSRSE